MADGGGAARAAGAAAGGWSEGEAGELHDVDGVIMPLLVVV